MSLAATQKQQADGINRDGLVEAAAKILFQPAYHGSPVRFDRFSTDFIGTGEGCQAFGWGMYFSGRQEVANWYRDNLSARKGEDPTQVPINGKTIMEWYHHFEKEAQAAPDFIGVLYDKMSMLEEVEIHWNAHGAMNTAIEDGLDPEAIDWFRNTIVPHFTRPGATYTVSIPDDSKILLWDAPLNENHPDTFSGLADATYWLKHRNLTPAELEELESGLMTGGIFYRTLSREMAPLVGAPFADKEASNFLHSHGIRGIKHLDIDARQTGEPNYNFVVFNDNDVFITDILFRRMKGEPPQAASAQIYILEEEVHTRYIISIFDNATPSSLPHEMSHLFLDMYEKMEKYPNAPSVVRSDMETIRHWAGIPPREPLTAAAQEKFAFATEEYIARGVEPSADLALVFQKFRGWVGALYDTTQKDASTTLTPEISAVIDRMLGSDIAPAETITMPGERLALEATRQSASAGRYDLAEPHIAAGRLLDAFHGTLVARGLKEDLIETNFSVRVAPAPHPGAQPDIAEQQQPASIVWGSQISMKLKSMDDVIEQTEKLKQRGAANGIKLS